MKKVIGINFLAVGVSDALTYTFWTILHIQSDFFVIGFF